MPAFIGIFDLIGTTASGRLTDRYDARRLFATYYGRRGLSLLALPVAYDSGAWGLGAFIVFFYGLAWVAAVPPTIRVASDLFGRQRIGTTYARIFAAHQVRGALIAWAAGSLRVGFGDYEVAFWLFGALYFLATGMALAFWRGSKDSEPVFTPTVLRAKPA
jgi:predicted MFS family arabinose efflux permease